MVPRWPVGEFKTTLNPTAGIDHCSLGSRLLGSRNAPGDPPMGAEEPIFVDSIAWLSRG